MVFCYLPIIVALICHVISTAIIVVTFICNYWLTVISDSTRFGVWVYCSNSSVECTDWYENSSSLYNILYFHDSYRVFQSFQTIFLALLLVGSLFIIFSVTHCKTNIPIFIVAGVIQIFSGIFGVISIIVFGTRIYDSDLHRLNWCYWVSVVAIFCALNAGVFTFAYAFDLRIDDRRRAKSPSTQPEPEFSHIERFNNKNNIYREKETTNKGSNWDDSNWTRTKSSNSDRIGEKNKKPSNLAVPEIDSERRSSTPRNEKSPNTKPKQRQEGPYKQNVSNARDRRVKPAKRRLSKQNRGLTQYREQQKNNFRKANNYVDRIPKLQFDNQSEITSISSISKRNAQENSKTFVFYNGVDSYSSGLVVDDQFVEETLRKAKYQNTRPLLKYKRI